MVAVRAVHLIPFLVLLPARVALAGEVTPAMVWTGTAPSGSCVGNRVAVVVTTGKPYCCSSGTWAACGISLPTCTGTDKLTSDGSTLTCAADSTSAGSGLPSLWGSGDGAHLDVAGEAVGAATPSAGSGRLTYQRAAAGAAGTLAVIDGASGLPFQLGPEVGWSGGYTQSECSNVIFGGTATGLTALPTTGTAQTWSAASLKGRSPRVRFTPAFSTDGGVYKNVTAWRGNTSGAGGFFWVAEWGLGGTVNGNERVMAGLAGTPSTVGSNPNGKADTVYFGCNTDDTLQICSNDNTGSATCSNLGASYPCADGAAQNTLFRTWLWAAPNASSIGWAIERLDAAATPASGSISTDLPRNSVQLGQVFGIFESAGSTTSLDFHGSCLFWNP